MAKKKVIEMRVELRGHKALRRVFKKLGKDAEMEVGKALYKEGEQIMRQSKQDFVPVKSGALRSSGHVQFPQPGPVVVLGFGGPAVPYAIVQHEGEFQHTVGQRKYLEIPVQAAAPGMPYRVRKELYQWLGRATAESGRRR
jgi:hypothetical protein